MITNWQGRCGECGRVEPLPLNFMIEAPRVCSSCYRRQHIPTAACGECGEVGLLPLHHPTEDGKGRVCPSCYGRLTGRKH